MIASDRYASVLNIVLEVAKKRGLENPGGEVASVCYELLDVALSEADVWGIPHEKIGLDKFNPESLLGQRIDAA